MAHELYKIQQEKNLKVTKFHNLEVTKLSVLVIKVCFHDKDLSLNHSTKIRAPVRLQPYHNIERFLKGKIKENSHHHKSSLLINTQNSGLRLHDFRCFAFQYEEDSSVKGIRQPEIILKDFLCSLCCVTYHRLYLTNTEEK